MVLLKDFMLQSVPEVYQNIKKLQKIWSSQISTVLIVYQYDTLFSYHFESSLLYTWKIGSFCQDLISSQILAVYQKRKVENSYI